MDRNDPNDFGFIFYDADHSESAMMFFFNWLIRKYYAGSLAVHDYNKPREFAGTQKAVNWFKQDNEFVVVGSLICLDQKSVASATHSTDRRTKS
jgi:hypothetical protein